QRFDPLADLLALGDLLHGNLVLLHGLELACESLARAAPGAALPQSIGLAHGEAEDRLARIAGASPECRVACHGQEPAISRLEGVARLGPVPEDPDAEGPDEPLRRLVDGPEVLRGRLVEERGNCVFFVHGAIRKSDIPGPPSRDGRGKPPLYGAFQRF